MVEKQVLQLNWRHDPPSKEILTKVVYFLTDATRDLEYDIVINGSTAKGACIFERVDANGTPDENGVLMWVRLRNTTRKQMRSRQEKLYWGRLSRICQSALERLDTLSPSYTRLLGYQLSTKCFSRDSIKNRLDDVSCTVGFHPRSMGSISDARGLVSVPDGFALRVNKVTNLCLYQNNRSTGAGIVHLRKECPIPSLVADLRLEPDAEQRFTLRAVIVTEHRNIRADIARVVDDKGGFQRCLFVMVG
jgi:hypothetical protein